MSAYLAICARLAEKPKGKVEATVYVNLEGDCLCHLGRYRQCSCRDAGCHRVLIVRAGK